MLAPRKPRYPIPEAIPRPDFTGPYVIEDGYASGVDLSKGRMIVSTGGPCVDCGQDHARASRIHEMGHTAFTPKDWRARVKRTKDKLPVDLVNAAEDARLNSRRAQARLSQPPPLLCEAVGDHYHMVRQTIRNGDLMGLARITLAAHESGDAELVRRAVAKVVDEMVARSEPAERLKAEHASDLVSQVADLARWHLRYRRATFRQSIALARDTVAAVERTAANYTDALETAAIASATKVKKHGDGKGKAVMPKGAKFGRMEIVSLPLPNRSKAGFERRWTARDEGDIPTRFDRWAIDKRVFRRKKRGKGAALLVDVSGSMSWSQHHLAQVLDEAPAATIAIYSGSGDKGQLVIVARNGRAANMSAAARHMLGGNVIDGPALAWLSEQPETVKLWMSDGGITGINDGPAGPEAGKYCSRMLRRGGIQQVRDARQVMDVLTGKQPFVPSREIGNRYW